MLNASLFIKKEVVFRIPQFVICAIKSHIVCVCVCVCVCVKGRKEMFYLTTHSTYFIKDHWDSERGNLVPPLHGLLFLISRKGFLYAPSHKQYSTYQGLC